MNKRHIYPKIEGKVVYFLSFLIPVVVMIAIYFAKRIYPFGENCFVRSDMYHQYLPFYSELWYKFHEAGSLLYSWNIGLGTNFLALLAYYLSSPFNLVLFIFPHDSLIEVMNIYIILKMALASVAFTYYITKHFNTKSIYISVFGMFYGLSGYLAAYNWNIMWLDCLIYLPLIIWGLERLYNQRKGVFYSLMLGFAIISNYYIGIMLCITMVIYFAFLFCTSPKNNIKDYIFTIIDFGIYSLLAGGLSAIVLLPEIYALKYTVSSDIAFPKVLNEYFSLLSVMARHFATVTSPMTGHLPSIYCGVAVFILVPLFIMNKNIKTSYKAGKIAILFIFIMSFALNIPNFIWHGFHYPNSLPCRQSFIYIFFLLTICYEAFKDIKYYSKKNLCTSLWIAVGFALIADHFLLDDNMNFTAVYISAAFICGYMMLIYFYKKRAIPHMLFLFLFFTSTIFECALNFEETGLSTFVRANYFSDNEDIYKILETAQKTDDSFYRVDRPVGRTCNNDGAWLNFKSASVFSSTASGGLTNLYKYLGMRQSTNAYSYDGATYFSSALFNVKYVISPKQLTEGPLLSYVDSSGSSYLYRNNFMLPFGFMTPTNLEEDWKMKNSNHFAVQNDFISRVSGINDIFVPINVTTITNTSVRINPVRTQHLYLYVLNDNLDKINIYINNTSSSYNIERNHIINLGIINATDEIMITSSDMSISNLAIQAYTINEHAFIEAVEKLSKNAFTPDTITDTFIEGNINVENDGNLLLSLPYDNGWKITVDGELVKQESLAEALTLLPITKGEHHIVMKYCPEGFKLGMAITIICGIILCALYYFAKHPIIKMLRNNAIKTSITEAPIANETVASEPVKIIDNAESIEISDNDSKIITADADKEE